MLLAPLLSASKRCKHGDSLQILSEESQNSHHLPHKKQSIVAYLFVSMLLERCSLHLCITHIPTLLVDSLMIPCAPAALSASKTDKRSSTMSTHISYSLSDSVYSTLRACPSDSLHVGLVDLVIGNDHLRLSTHTNVLNLHTHAAPNHVFQSTTFVSRGWTVA